MKTNSIGLGLLLVCGVLLVACGGGGDDGGVKSKVGENCLRTADCVSGLSCIQSTCVAPGVDGDNETTPSACSGACNIASDIATCFNDGLKPLRLRSRHLEAVAVRSHLPPGRENLGRLRENRGWPGL